MELIPYSKIKKEISILLDDRDANLAELSDKADLLKKQKTFLDTYTKEELKEKRHEKGITYEERQLLSNIIYEKEIYSIYSDEVENIINKSFKGIKSRKKKRATKIKLLITATVLASIGGVICLVKKNNSNEDKKEETTISKESDINKINEGTDKVAEFVTNAPKNNELNTDKESTTITVPTTESTEKIVKEPEIVIIKEESIETKKEDSKPSNNNTGTKSNNDSTIKNNDSQRTNDKKSNDNGSNTKTEGNNNDKTKSNDKIVDNKKTETTKTETTKKEETKDNKKEDKTKENKNKEKETKDSEYINIEPSTVVIDNTNDDKSDVVVDEGKSNEPLPSTDNVDDENKNKNKNNENIVLPPIDNNVEGDDEGIEFDITGSSNIGKKLTLSRGRL